MDSEKRVALIVSVISQLIVQLIANMTVVALPDISVDLNFSANTIMWVNLIYLMSFVAFSIPFSKIISHYGVKRSIRISLLALFVSAIISVFSPDENIFLLSRFIQGLTSASLAIGLYVMIVEEFEERELGYALGAVASAGYVGMLIAPSFMGFITYFTNWRLAFLIMIPIVFVLLALTIKIKKEWFIDNKPFNLIGSFLYIIALSLFTIGLATINKYGIIFVIISLVLVVLFVTYDRKVKNRLVNLSLFRNPNYIIGNYGAMVTYFTTTIVITVLSFHLQYVLNTEEYIVGLVLIITPTIMIGMSNVAGGLSNRIDPRVISGIAMIFLFMAMCIYFVIDFIPFEIILLGCAFQGIGNGMFSAPNNKYVLTIVDEDNLAEASSMLSTSKEFGKILSSGIYTLILAFYLGSQSLGPEHLDPLLIQSSNLMMFICMIMTFSATVFIFYGKYRYEHGINPRIVKLFKSLEPEWLKKRREG